MTTNKWLLILILSLGFFTSLVADTEEEIKTTDHAEIKGIQGDKLTIKLVPEHATVGKMAKLKASYLNKNGIGETVIYDLSFFHIEDNKEVYHTVFFSGKDGLMDIEHQFFDGAAHKIILKALPEKGESQTSLKVEMTIDVEGIDPPTPVVFRTLFFLIGCSALALAMGYILSIKI